MGNLEFNSSGVVEIKGYGNDIVIVLSDEGDLSNVEEELIRKLENSDRFFSGVEVVLDLGTRSLDVEACERLKGILSDKFNLKVLNVRSRASETRKSVEKIGWKLDSRKRSVSLLRKKIESPIKTDTGAKKDSRTEAKKDARADLVDTKNDTFLLKGTLRSGQKRWHRGNIVIIGDVNPGAEVIATGDIVIMGTLRGVAHAGVEGDASAKIIALELQPIQLRIAGYIRRSPDLNIQKGEFPEVAGIEDGNIVIRKLT